MNKSREFLHTNDKLKVLFAGALIAGGVSGCNKNNIDDSGETIVAQNRADAVHVAHRTENATGETGRSANENVVSPPSGSSFRFSTFRVPSDGVLVERKAYGDGRESVVYILDYHNNSTVVSDFQRNVQREIFGIVEGITGSYGRTPVAMETWKIGDTADNYVFKTSDSDLLDELFSASTLSARRSMVPGVMRDTKFAGPVIVGTFRESVVPVGTMTEAERQGANELVRIDRRLRQAVTGGTSFCTGTDGRNHTFYEARDAFRRGGSDVTDHCYCAVHEFEDRFLDRFRTRMTSVPVREVNYATAADGNFSVVISGLKHWPAAKAELERQGVNYTAVAPKTLAPGVEEKLREDSIRAYYPDSADNRCDTLMRDRRALVEAALGRI